MIEYICPECGHTLEQLCLCSNPPKTQMRCNNCGWSWASEPKLIQKIPFEINLHERTIKVVEI